MTEAINEGRRTNKENKTKQCCWSSTLSESQDKILLFNVGHIKLCSAKNTVICLIFFKRSPADKCSYQHARLLFLVLLHNYLLQYYYSDLCYFNSANKFFTANKSRWAFMKMAWPFHLFIDIHSRHMLSNRATDNGWYHGIGMEEHTATSTCTHKTLVLVNISDSFPPPPHIQYIFCVSLSLSLDNLFFNYYLQLFCLSEKY